MSFVLKNGLGWRGLGKRPRSSAPSLFVIYRTASRACGKNTESLRETAPESSRLQRRTCVLERPNIAGQNLAVADMHINETAIKDATSIDAMQAITDAMHRMAMKLIVLDMAFKDSIATMPNEQKKRFSASFKARATSVMQEHSNMLMPTDDSEISMAVSQILKASAPTNYL